MTASASALTLGPLLPQENRPEQRAAVSVAPGVLEQLAQAEAARKQGGGIDQKGGTDEEEKISDAMVRKVCLVTG